MSIEIKPFNIGIEKMSDQLMKYHVSNGDDTPWPFRPVFHHFTGPYQGDPHDHPFGFTTYIIQGWYMEEIYDKDGSYSRYMRISGQSVFIPSYRVHRITEISEDTCWTMIVQETEKIQEPGFWKMENGIFKKTFWYENQQK